MKSSNKRRCGEIVLEGDFWVEYFIMVFEFVFRNEGREDEDEYEFF